MEIRKLQKTGGSSLTLTLPKKWINLLGLRDKDSVRVIFDKNGLLIIQPTNEKHQMIRSALPIDNLTNNMLIRELIAHYISGTDEIIISSKQIAQDQRRKIREAFQLLIGFEIVDESATKILVKNVFDATKFPISQSIEKMFHITKSMIQDSCKALFYHDKLLANDVRDRDFEVDKLYLIITRQLHILMRNKTSEEALGLGAGDLYYYEDIAVQLERIADHAVKISLIVALDATTEQSLYIPPSQEIIEEISSLIDQAECMVEKQDATLAHKILDANEQVVKVTSPYISLERETLMLQIIAEDSLDRIRGYIMNMAELTIDQNVAKKII